MTGTPMFWDFGSSCIRRCGVLNASCCGSECKARFWFSLVLPNVSFLHPAGVRVVPTETVMSAFSLVVSSTGNLNISIFGLHEEVEVQCVRWSNSQFQHHDIRKCRKPWRRETSTFTRSWTCQCFHNAQGADEKLVSSLTGSRLHGSKFRDDTRGHSVPRIRFFWSSVCSVVQVGSCIDGSTRMLVIEIICRPQVHIAKSGAEQREHSEDWMRFLGCSSST